jgi:hypothetical protein
MHPRPRIGLFPLSLDIRLLYGLVLGWELRELMVAFWAGCDASLRFWRAGLVSFQLLWKLSTDQLVRELSELSVASLCDHFRSEISWAWTLRMPGDFEVLLIWFS